MLRMWLLWLTAVLTVLFRFNLSTVGVFWRIFNPMHIICFTHQTIWGAEVCALILVKIILGLSLLLRTCTCTERWHHVMSISIYSSYKAHTELKKFKRVSLRSNKKNGAGTNAVDDDGVSPGGVRMSNIPQNVVDIRAVRVCGAHAAAILLFFLLFLTVHRRQAPRSVPAGLPPGHSAQRTHKSNKGKNCLCKRSLRIVLKKQIN